jgi:hypothetical protein
MSLHLALHGLVVKKRADAAAIAEFTGLDLTLVSRLLADAVGSGRAVLAQGQYTLAPLVRASLDAQYSREYAALRANQSFVEAYEAFERINVDLKALITDWQTIEVGGSRIRNEHTDRNYDSAIIDRLGELHERAARVLRQLASVMPRFTYYDRHLLAALEKAEDGAIEWVSDARLASYHTVWFELHEDLLRLLGRKRTE